MFAELLQKLDAMDLVAKATREIYEENISFYHPIESSLIENTLNDFTNKANSYRTEITEWLNHEEGNIGFWPLVVGAAIVASAAVAFKYAPIIEKNLDIDKQKLDQAFAVAQIGPERAAAYEAALTASPETDIDIKEFLRQFKAEVTPGFSWGMIAAVGVLAWLYFRGNK